MILGLIFVAVLAVVFFFALKRKNKEIEVHSSTKTWTGGVRPGSDEAVRVSDNEENSGRNSDNEEIL